MEIRIDITAEGTETVVHVAGRLAGRAVNYRRAGWHGVDVSLNRERRRRRSRVVELGAERVA